MGTAQQGSDQGVGACAGCAYGLSEVIESEGHSAWIAAEERRVADLSWLWSPYDGFKVEDLRAGAVDCHTGTASRVWIAVAMLVLRVSRHGAKIVDRSEAGVGASES